MNYIEAKELAMKMVKDMGESIFRVYNHECEEDESHVEGPCVVVFMEQNEEGSYKIHIMRHYKCCVKDILSQFGSMTEGSVAFMNREGTIATFVCIEEYVIGISVKLREDKKAVDKTVN